MNTAELFQDGRETASVGASFADRPPLGGTAPSGGSAVREATSVGAIERRAGPPQAGTAPSGGRELHAVSERGGHMHSAGPPQASSAPEGLEPAAPSLLEQVWTGDRGEASREPRPARPRALHAVKSVGAAICSA